MGLEQSIIRSRGLLVVFSRTRRSCSNQVRALAPFSWTNGHKVRSVQTAVSGAEKSSDVVEKKPNYHAEIFSGPPEYPFPGTLEPANEEDYDKFVAYWRSHFIHCNDRYELDRGLNMIFTSDWVPDVRVIEDAIHACRRLSDFAVAVRIVVCLEKCAYNSELYREYMVKLRPLLEELGIPTKEELGEFKMTFKRIPWMQ